MNHSTTYPSTRTLLDWRHHELEELFSTLTPGDLPSGNLRGTLFGIAGLQRLPRILNRIVLILLSTPINPWRGKSFNAGHGSNLWLFLRGPRFGHYRIGANIGPDGGQSHWLDYNVDSNIAPLKPIRGEARQLASGQWLCRMLWQGKKGAGTLLWFTLSKANA
tara:strand:+ start:13013 stop:13501 length:489 start_codon:yes stop_codon:yes gene_type:complete